MAALIAVRQWEEWVNFAFAVWLIVSPWILGFGGQQTALWNQIVIGIAVGALAFWSSMDKYYEGGGSQSRA